MNRPEPETPSKPPSGPTLQALLILLMIAVTLAILMTQRGSPVQPPEPTLEIPYTEFKRLVEQRRVQRITMRGHALHGELHESRPLGPDRVESARFTTRVPAIGDADLLALLEAGEVAVAVEDDTVGVSGQLLIALLPMALLVFLLFWLFRRTASQLGGRLGGRGELDRFLDTSTRQAKVPEVRFSDVAGQENAKRDVSELVECLRNPEAFRAIGAEIPRGVLMMGPPGTGKTLMARALAGEAEVPFYSVSGSEFIEVYVGVGASRVRRLFEHAKRNAPSIVFIDELDSIGRTRGTGLGGGHDEREQTLNQILAEMDGFAGHEAVIVLAATNRPDVLDPALLRPGRFDRHLTLELPDRQDRVALLGVHTRKVQLAPDVDLERIAAGTAGFSGADIKNLVNEAAILAVRDRRARVSTDDFEEARDKLLLGSVRTLAIQPEERHRLAVHEAGHALVAHRLAHADPVYKVTIIPRGRSLGGTHQLPEQERHMFDEPYLRTRLAVMLGGRCAEKALLGSVSSGADDDIRQATALARSMVARWGMAEDIGPIDLSVSEQMPFLGREIAQPRRHSEDAARAVDAAVSALLSAAQRRALELIEQERAGFEALVALLEEREILDREDISACLGDAGAGAAAGRAAHAALESPHRALSRRAGHSRLPP